MEPDDTSRAGKPATCSSSSAGNGEPPSKKPRPRFNAHRKYTMVENALETAQAQAIDMGFELKQTSSHLDAAKAELEAKDKDGDTALDDARGKNETECVAVLEAAMR